MSIGNRIFRTAIAGLALILALISAGLYYQAEYAHESNARADNYAKHASDQIEQACVGIVRTEKAQCLRKAITEYRKQADDNRRDYNDLTAQRTSALWTQIMGIAALIGMGLSVVGVVLVWTTFRETKRSSDAAVKNYEAFVKFESPMLDVDFSKLSFLLINNEPHANVRFAVRNIGRSPAIIDIVTVQGSAEPVAYNKIIASGQTLELREPFTFPISDRRSTFGLIEFATAMSAGKKRLFIMNFAGSGASWVGSIHPGEVLAEGNPEYTDPFGIDVPEK